MTSGMCVQDGLHSIITAHPFVKIDDVWKSTTTCKRKATMIPVLIERVLPSLVFGAAISSSSMNWHCFRPAHFDHCKATGAASARFVRLVVGFGLGWRWGEVVAAVEGPPTSTGPLTR